MALPHQLISAAFVRERDEIRVGHLVEQLADHITVRGLDGEEWQRTAAAPEALATTVRRSNVTHHDGAPIVLFHPGRGLLALLADPSEPPAHLHIVAAVDLESDVPTEVLGGDPSETWLVFETSPVGDD